MSITDYNLFLTTANGLGSSPTWGMWASQVFFTDTTLYPSNHI